MIDRSSDVAAASAQAAAAGKREWRPLLEGEEAERAWEAIHAVAAALEPEAAREDVPPERGFPDGSAGFALLFAYLARATGSSAWADVADRLADQAVRALADHPMPPVLFGGFPGIGWTLEHLAPLFDDGEGAVDGAGEADEEDPIDAAVERFLDRPAVEGEFDLISGLAGLGVYALEGLPRPSARRCLERVVERLVEIGTEVEDGFTWFTPLELVPAHQRWNAPHGCYNLGVAHGAPAVISLLGSCAAAGVLTPDQRRILDRAVSWLLARKRPGTGWCFPAWYGEDVRPFPSRLAWCYGDPGIAGALFSAARHAGERRWEEEALGVARRAAARSPEHAEVRDAGICHGSAGLAHLFNRMYQASGDPDLAEAARYWVLDTLRRRRPGEGVAGFLRYRLGDDGGDEWVADAGVLTGAAGIALVLLSAVAPVEPAWDRVLTVSVPLEPPSPGRSGRA